jgi:hypothetical protein
MASGAQRALARAAIAIVALVVLLSVAQPATACSRFAPENPEEQLREDLRRADAAIVGRLIEVRPVQSRRRYEIRADFRYRVERVYKGRRLGRGRTVTVRSVRDEAACGLPNDIGRRYGLLLHRRRGRPAWKASLFDAVSPRELRAAARA